MSSLIRYKSNNPWKLFDDLFGFVSDTYFWPTWDLGSIDKEGTYSLRVEVPGVSREQVEAEVIGTPNLAEHYLTLKIPGKPKYYLSPGSNYDLTKSKVVVKDGILIVTVPLVPVPPKNIIKLIVE